MIIKELSYGNILKNISFELKANAICCILGENGSGKSTLIKTLAGYYKNYSGSIVANTEIKTLNEKQLKLQRSVLTQKNFVHNYISCYDYLSLAISPTNTQHETVMKWIIDFLDIESLLDKKYIECSGGEQQKIDIARIVLQAKINKAVDKPYYIFMDEPFNSIDVKYVPTLVNCLNQLKNEGFSLVLVLHDINLAYSLCDGILMLNKGSMVTNGTKDNFTSENLEKTFGVSFSVLEIGVRKVFEVK